MAHGPSERYFLKKGELNDGEFEDFLAEIAPALEQSVGRLGVAGHLGVRANILDPAKFIMSWPEVADRVIEELR
ncbi:MAG TPA: hypothetical protein VGJ64_06580 [Gemmatimonadaceae bacterium]